MRVASEGITRILDTKATKEHSGLELDPRSNCSHHSAFASALVLVVLDSGWRYFNLDLRSAASIQHRALEFRILAHLV